MNRTLLMALVVGSALPLAACNNKSKPHNRNRSTTAGIHSDSLGGLPGMPNPNVGTGNGNGNPNPSTPMARVADYGDPSGEEQELIELMQRARRDPAAEGARLNQAYGLSLNFAGYAKRPPLSPNGFLATAAKKHSDDMATRGFYGHVNPDGDNANGRVLDAGYALNDYFGTNRTINLTENIGKGTGAAPGNLLTTAQSVHDAFMIDANVTGTKHRQMILGNGQFAKYREVGPGYLHRAPSDYITEEFAYTKTDRPFVLGVAFDDRNGDGIAQDGEGTPGVTVTLSHASGFSISTQSLTAGGFSFEVFVDGTYTLTIDGKSTQVTVTTDSTKVDLKSGQLTTY
jgi:serralysin